MSGSCCKVFVLAIVLDVMPLASQPGADGLRVNGLGGRSPGNGQDAVIHRARRDVLTLTSEATEMKTMCHESRTWLPVIPLLWLLASPALAQPASPPRGETRTAEATEADEDQESEPLNELALVVAGTRERAEDQKETSFTIGAEYDRRFTSRLGIVIELEHVSGPDSWVFAAPLVFRPAAGWKLFAGPGLERRRESEGIEGGEREGVADAPATDRENRFLWRFGTGYAWEISKRYVVGPSFYLDAIREEPGEWTRAFVFAFTVGFAF